MRNRDQVEAQAARTREQLDRYHQTNEHRLTSIEGWLRLNAGAVLVGALVMAMQLAGLRSKVIEQNGRVTKLENDHLTRDGREAGASQALHNQVKLLGVVLVLLQIIAVIIGVLFTSKVL